MAHSGVLSGKSFQSFTVNDNLIAKAVEAVKAGDAKARSTGKIQSFEVFQEGFRTHLVIGRIMVIPAKITDSPEDFPIALLYGRIMKEINPEDIQAMMVHKIGENEFDEMDKKSWTRVKDELFKNAEEKTASIVVFLPAWANPHEFIYFHMVKEDGKLAELLAHQVFSCYFDPRLSSAFDAILTDVDTFTLDVTDITAKMNFPFIAEGNEKEYPDLNPGDEDGKLGGQSAQKRSSLNKPKKIMVLAHSTLGAVESLLASEELDVIASLDDALTSAMGKEAHGCGDKCNKCGEVHGGSHVCKQADAVQKDVSEAKSEVVSPDTVDKDIKQPTESVPAAAGESKTAEGVWSISDAKPNENNDAAVDKGLKHYEASEKKADTADNPAAEKGAEGAIENKTDADIKNTQGTAPKFDVTAGGHASGCDCGFCKNKGSMGKKDDEKGEEKEASAKTADTADNPAAEKDQAGAIVPKTDADIKNTQGEKPKFDVTGGKKVGRHMGKCSDCGKDRSLGEDNKCPQCEKKGEEDKAASVVANAIGEDRTENDHVASRKHMDKAAKREARLATLRMVADVPLTEESIWSAITTDFGPAPQVELPGENSGTSSEAPAEVSSNESGVEKALPESTPAQESEGAKPFNDQQTGDAVKIDKGDNTTPPEKSAPSKEAKVANMSMKCPKCGKQASKDRHEDPYKCACGWESTQPKAAKKANTLHGQMSEFNDLSAAPKMVAGNAVVSGSEIPSVGGPVHNKAENPNATAIKDAMETVAEQEIGMPIAEKAQNIADEVHADDVAHQDMANAVPKAEVTEAAGGKIVINITASKLTAQLDSLLADAEKRNISPERRAKIKAAAETIRTKIATVVPDAINVITTQNMGQNHNPSAPAMGANRETDVKEEHLPQLTEAEGAKQEHANDASESNEDGTTKASEAKEAGFNFFFPGQVLKEFYPELQHNLVDYPNDNNTGMEDAAISGGEINAPGDATNSDVNAEEVALPGVNVLDEALNVVTAFGPTTDFTTSVGVSTSPAGGAGIGRDGKPQVLDGAPLRKEDDIRGPMFTEEFFQNSMGVPGKFLTGSKKGGVDDKAQLNNFLKAVVGEIAATFVSAFKVANRGINLKGVPGKGKVQLQQIEGENNGLGAMSSITASRISSLLERVNDGDIRDAVNGATAQAAVWSKGAGGFTYEVYVRAEAIDKDEMTMKYSFVTGTKG